MNKIANCFFLFSKYFIIVSAFMLIQNPIKTIEVKVNRVSFDELAWFFIFGKDKKKIIMGIFVFFKTEEKKNYTSTIKMKKIEKFNE